MRRLLRSLSVNGPFLQSSLNAVLVFLCAVKTKRLHGARRELLTTTTRAYSPLKNLLTKLSEGNRCF